MRTKHFKMMLTPAEYERIQDMACEQRVTAADLVRALVPGPEACIRLPSSAALREILMKLARISDNINRCQKQIHTAKLDGSLNQKQFGAMFSALETGHKDWAKPLAELREQMRFAKPRPQIAPELPTRTDD
ncbi:plasmid mobilization protein [Ruegeria atlantica]|uniref:plasmid mobilization protein n=1 Tax=Ruegeria atlantica TaxID=81569 RepID=UPI00147E0ACC|nr:hypothetical protein [Ruegeria atlantica]